MEEIQILDINFYDVIKTLFDEFKIVLEKSKPIEKFLYCQIYVEHLVDSILETGAYNPTVLKVSKTNFVSKVDICIAFGFIHKEMRAPIMKIANMRNDIAHNIDAEISHKKITDLKNDLQRASKNQIKITQNLKLRTSDGIFADCFQQIWNYLFFQHIRLSICREDIFKTLQEHDLVSEKPELQMISTPKSLAIAIEKTARKTQSDVFDEYEKKAKEMDLTFRLTTIKKT